jgi:hypothetical protein
MITERARMRTVWRHMRHRCADPLDRSYHRYGGRGIKVCARWQDFNAFLADMGTRPQPGMQLDRIDNNGNYEPANCRWATPRANSRNTCQCVFITHNGQRRIATEWAEILGLSASTIAIRARKGRPPEECLSKIRLRSRAERRYTFAGKTMTVVQWAKELGIQGDVLSWRIRQGLPPADIFCPGPLSSHREHQARPSVPRAPWHRRLYRWQAQDQDGTIAAFEREPSFDGASWAHPKRVKLVKPNEQGLRPISKAAAENSLRRILNPPTPKPRKGTK